MNAYELAEKAQGLAYEIPADWSSGEPKNVATDIANMLRQQADRIDKLEREAVAKNNYLEQHCEKIDQQADRIAELEFENKAFRKELFNIGSMRSCSYAAQHHGFVSPRQAGDDAREYIAEILEKAKKETK